MVSLMPRYCRSTPASMIHSAPISTPDKLISRVPSILCGMGSNRGVTAHASPPSTTAPSPPIMIKPARAGNATHKAVSISGAARDRVFWNENQSPKAPLNRVSHTSQGLTPCTQTKPPNRISAADKAETGSRRARTVGCMVFMDWLRRCRVRPLPGSSFFPVRCRSGGKFYPPE